MTQLTGCRPSDKEIVDKFDDFITMFPTEDLTVLYDKEGDTSALPPGDLGTWRVSSYLYTKNEEDKKVVGIVLGFDKNTKQSNGDFIIRETKEGSEIENKYPIIYDKYGIHLLDENLEESVKEELTNFNMMYDFISLNKKYLDDLEAARYNYNSEVPLYDVTYKLTSEDINVNKIKEIYPNLPVDDDNISLYLEGHDFINKLSLKIYLDEKHDYYFSSSMTLNKSDSFNG